MGFLQNAAEVLLGREKFKGCKGVSSWSPLHCEGQLPHLFGFSV